MTVRRSGGRYKKLNFKCENAVFFDLSGRLHSRHLHCKIGQWKQAQESEVGVFLIQVFDRKQWNSLKCEQHLCKLGHAPNAAHEFADRMYNSLISPPRKRIHELPQKLTFTACHYEISLQYFKLYGKAEISDTSYVFSSQQRPADGAAPPNRHAPRSPFMQNTL